MAVDPAFVDGAKPLESEVQKLLLTTGNLSEKVFENLDGLAWDIDDEGSDNRQADDQSTTAAGRIRRLYVSIETVRSAAAQAENSNGRNSRGHYGRC